MGEKAMPSFSQPSIASITSGTPNWFLILTDIRQHILQVTGDLYPTSAEYRNMGQAIIKEYPSLADVDDKDSFVSIIITIITLYSY